MRGIPNLTVLLLIKSQNIDNWKVNLKSFSVFVEGTYKLEQSATITDLSDIECEKYRVDTTKAS